MAQAMTLNKEFCYGKYRSETLKKVMTEHPNYLYWLMCNTNILVSPISLGNRFCDEYELAAKNHTNINFDFLKEYDKG